MIEKCQFTMPAKYKKAWLEALRSGKYHQASGMLKTESFQGLGGESFCCLGVLQQVVSGDVERATPSVHKPEGYPIGMPTPTWCESHGIVADWDKLGAVHPMRRLAVLNDTGNSFNEIANVIEKEVETTD